MVSEDIIKKTCQKWNFWHIKGGVILQYEGTIDAGGVFTKPKFTLL